VQNERPSTSGVHVSPLQHGVTLHSAPESPHEPTAVQSPLPNGGGEHTLPGQHAGPVGDAHEPPTIAHVRSAQNDMAPMTVQVWPGQHGCVASHTSERMRQPATAHWLAPPDDGATQLSPLQHCPSAEQISPSPLHARHVAPNGVAAQ